MRPIFEEVMFWTRGTALTLLSLGIIEIGAHDALDDYRPISTPQAPIVIESQSYAPHWLADHRGPPFNTESDRDEYVHLAQLIENEEQINATGAAIEATAPTIQVLKCIPVDPGYIQVIGLLIMPPQSSKGTIIDQSLMTQASLGTDLTCDDKNRYKIKTD